MKRRIHFFKETVRNIKTTGSVTHSSKFLCKRMIKPVDFETATLLVELGAGDGVITKHILREMRPDATLLVFEINPKFCERIRMIKDKRMILIEDSAENLSAHLKRLDLPKVNSIISAIPFVALPKSVVNTIILECKNNLQPGGKFVQMQYSLLLKKTYQNIFGNVKIDFTPANIPPAFVLTSVKK